MKQSTEGVAVAVRAVIAAHAQAQDAGRTDDIVALYTADAVLEVPGMPTANGREALRAAFKGWAPAQPQLHIVSNTVLTDRGAEEDGEVTAVSDVAFLQRGDSGWAVQLVGRYEDTLFHEEGAWRFKRRSSTFTA
ncbi:nuclear transport factor 2 family protein [Streptomyces sp. NPDC050264]|uniref:nuclear transport factor 2 family protein n=1 Tax=Streptomyces sp. NPDC050264 TaxID=3155038 RepID=UPI003423F6BF